MADYEDTKVKDLIINNMSQEKFDELKNAGELDPTQLYCTPEEGGAGGDYLPLSGGTLTGVINFEYNDGPYGNEELISWKSHKGLAQRITTGQGGEGIMFGFSAKSIHFTQGGTVYGLNELGSQLVHVSKVYTNTLSTKDLSGNGGDLIVPTESGTLARIEDINNIVEVLPTADNGYTTVKNFGNGYVEITGYASIGTVGAGTGSEVQIDLPAGYTMADANYWVNIAPTSETTMFDFKAEAKARSTTHFMVAYKNEDTTTGLTAAGVYWEVRGMLATTEA